MALDTFAIQLKLELERFIKNIADARLRIKGIEKQAAETSKKISESFSAIEGPKESIEDTEGAISKLGGTLLRVGKIITVAGGIVAGLTVVRFLLADVADGAPRLASVFGTLGTGVSTLAGSLSGLARVLLGAGSAVTFITGQLASLAGSFAGIQTGLITLAASPAVRIFASTLVDAFDAVAFSIGRAVKSIPRLAGSLGNLVIGGKRVSQIFSALPGLIGGVAAALGNFAVAGFNAGGVFLTRLVPNLTGIIKPIRNAVIAFAAFTAFLRGAVSATVINFVRKLILLTNAFDAMVIGGAAGIPVLGKLLVTFKKTAIGAALFGLAAGDAGAAAAVMTAGVGGLNIAIIALNAVIGITGIILTKLGKALLSTAEKLGILAAKTELAAKNIEFGLTRANAATAEGVGELENLNKLIEETADKFGASVKFVTETTAAFIALQPEMRLSSELFKQVIEDTVVLAVTTGQSSRALIDVADVFKNISQPLRNFAAISTSLTEVQERLSKDSVFLSEVLSKITENTEDNIIATARAIIVTEGLSARQRTLTEGSNNLIIAQGRLTAAFENLGVQLGQTVSPILSRIVDTLKAFTNILSSVPGPLKAVVGQIITLAGVAAVLVGTFLKLATAIILVTNAGRILNSILPLQIGQLGKLSEIIQRNTFAFTGQAIAVTSASGVFRSFFAIANEGFRRVTISLNNFIKALLVFDLTRLTKGFSGFGSSIEGVGLKAKLATIGTKIFRSSIFLLIKTLGPLILAIEFISRLFSRLNKRYKVAEALTRLVNRVFGTQFKVVEALAFILAKLSQILEVGVLVAMGAVELAAFTLILAFIKILDVIQFMNAVIDTFTLGIFKLEARFKSLTKGIREVAQDGLDQLGENLNQTTKDIVKLIARVASAKTGFEDAEDAIDGTGKAAKKIVVTVKQLAVGFDILRASLNAAFKNTEEQFETQLQNLQIMRDAQIELVDATIQSEDLKAKRVLQIERQTSRQIIALSERRLNKALKDIDTREQAELKAIEIASDTEGQSFEERIKSLAEVTQAANEARLERLREFEKTTDAEIDAEQAAARKRIKIIEDAARDIENTEKAGLRRREDRLISLLSDQKQAAARQTRFEKGITTAREQRAKGEFDLADQTLKQAKADAGTLVGRAVKTAEAQTLANQGGATKDRRIASQRLSDINTLFFGRLPQIAKDSFNAVSNAIRKGLDPSDAFKALERDLARVAKRQTILARNAAEERVEAEVAATQAAREKAGDVEKKEAIKRIKEIRKENIEAAQEIEKLKEKIAKPFEVVAEFFAKPEDVARIFAIRDRIKEAIQVPVIFGGDEAALEIGKITKGQKEIIRAAQLIKKEGIIPATQADIERTRKDFSELGVTRKGPGDIGKARLAATARKFNVPLGDPSQVGGGFVGPGAEEARAKAKAFTKAFQVQLNATEAELEIALKALDAADVAAATSGLKPVEIEVTPKADPTIDITNVFGEKVDIKVAPDPLAADQTQKELEQTITPRITLELKTDTDGTMRVVRQIQSDIGTIDITVKAGIKPEDAQAALAKAKQQFKEGINIDLRPSISPESQARVDLIKQKIAAPIKDPVIFEIDQASASAVNQFRAKVGAPIRIKVIVDRVGEVEGGSPHNLDDIAKVLRNLLTPGPLMANVRADATDAMKAVNGGGGATAPSRIVRVDINMDGESTPINVASDADAERLTTFAERLKNIGRTKGNFRSPFVRNS